MSEALRARLGRSGKSLRLAARDANVSPGMLSLVLSGQRKPAPKTLNSILRSTATREERASMKTRETQNGATGSETGAGRDDHDYVTLDWKRLLQAALLAILALIMAVCGVGRIEPPQPPGWSGCQGGVDCSIGPKGEPEPRLP
ncbi:helix-turn-helix transcriptional regulator [Streptomyces sp. NPDC002935]|uniref:helix-turn-helix transcriptional regulator n=1 Tax=unclassified Streptomyces TaxID=2593676 RepID=UPI003321E22F